MKTMAEPVRNKKFIRIVHRKLTEYGIISQHQEIRIQPCHSIQLNGQYCYHYIITCRASNQTYFLKAVKPGDGSFLCNSFLSKIRNACGECPYPIILVPSFDLLKCKYYITSFVEGQTLDVASSIIQEETWNDIADVLFVRFRELKTIQASQYSEQGKFVTSDYASILKWKLMNKLQHPSLLTLDHNKLAKISERCFEILDKSQFSKPTLLHMDIKPANIIYNPSKRFISLIDFELARFGDIDYGWAQILLSEHNRFGKAYKEHLLPRLIQRHLGLTEVLQIPKYQCYLFYQSICNFIYYYDHNMKCPEEMKAILYQIMCRLER